MGLDGLTLRFNCLYVFSAFLVVGTHRSSCRKERKENRPLQHARPIEEKVQPRPAKPLSGWRLGGLLHEATRRSKLTRFGEARSGERSCDRAARGPAVPDATGGGEGTRVGEMMPGS